MTNLQTEPSGGPEMSLVLDTNVVLDWLVFDEPTVRPLAAAVEDGTVAWYATTAMREELAEVLRRDDLGRWRPDPPAVLACWDRHARIVDTAPPAPLAGLRCTDADDQKFVDLAIHRRVDALLSHDRAVLRLAAAARRHGVAILRAAAWAAARR